MGGHCSQKLCPGGESQSPPGRSRSSHQYEIHNSTAKIGCPRARFPGPSLPPSVARGRRYNALARRNGGRLCRDATIAEG